MGHPSTCHRPLSTLMFPLCSGGFSTGLVEEFCSPRVTIQSFQRPSFMPAPMHLKFPSRELQQSLCQKTLTNRLLILFFLSCQGLHRPQNDHRRQMEKPYHPTNKVNHNRLLQRNSHQKKLIRKVIRPSNRKAKAQQKILALTTS